MPVEVVISRFDENVSYISEINQQIFLYDKSGSVANAKYIPCIGREDFTYLYHILNSEDNDNTHICFLQGNPFDHCPDILSILNSPIDSDLIWLNDYFGNKLIRTGLHGDAHHLHVGQITEMLFEKYTRRMGLQSRCPVHYIQTNHTFQKQKVLGTLSRHKHFC